MKKCQATTRATPSDRAMKVTRRAPVALGALLAPAQRRSGASNRSAFSLIEVLLAIMILGVGVISIAALFPAGIAQQRMSNDDMMGPIVASNAMAVIRSKLSPDDFGTFEEFGVDPGWPISATQARGTIPGDWPWTAPSFLLGDDTSTNSMNPAIPAWLVDDTGTIDIFASHSTNPGPQSPPVSCPYCQNAGGYQDTNGTQADPPLFGIPYNKLKYDDPASPGVFDPRPPRILISQQERYYPMVSKAFTGSAAQPRTTDVRPQYVWECMFRRFQGRILVAIFVYRVSIPGGAGDAGYTVPARLQPFDRVPNLPVALNLLDPVVAATYSYGGPWDAPYSDTPEIKRAYVAGAGPNIALNLSHPAMAWQDSRQWILDQNNNIHRVIGVSRDALGQPVRVELSRPITPVLARNNMAVADPPWTDTPYFYLSDPTVRDNVSPRYLAEDNVVTQIYYIPLELPVDRNGDGMAEYTLNLTPVYATVQEL